MLICCKTEMIHPFLLEEYTMVEKEYLGPIYVNKGNRILCISKPVSHTHNLGNSWVVGHSPEAKWGFMSSSKNSVCPDIAGPTMAGLSEGDE